MRTIIIVSDRPQTLGDLPTKPRMYGVRNRLKGLLYVGKPQDIKERFRSGDKTIIWLWLKDYDHRDVSIELLHDRATNDPDEQFHEWAKEKSSCIIQNKED